MKLRRKWSLQRFFWRRIRGYEGELCYDCGRPYHEVIWEAPPHVWSAITHRPDGESGLFCPSCFSLRARRQGMFLMWEPTIEKIRVTR